MLEVTGEGAPAAGPTPRSVASDHADEQMRIKAHKLCRDYLHGAWMHISPQEMIFRKVSGGLSNLLYFCGLPEGRSALGQEPVRLLLRLYGRANEDAAMETLVTESVIFALLSESQRGPRLYGVFPGGRLEEYIPARALLTKELVNPELSCLIAEKMAQIHQMDVPINKRPKWLWQTMNKWLVSINEEMCQGSLSDEQEALFKRIKDLNLASELSWLKTYLTSVDSPVVFCHNDLQEGNILLINNNNNNNVDNKNHNSTGPKSQGLVSDDAGVSTNPSKGATFNVLIIDYEYCSYNHRGFDIANHFSEWVYDYTNEEPPYFWEYFENQDPVKEEFFMRHYLEGLKKNPSYKKGPKDTLECLKSEVKVFKLASHFFWALWSIINSTVSKISFDYSGYGEARFKAYYKLKEDLLN